MRRHAVGIVALISLVGALALWIWAPHEGLAYSAAANMVRGGAFLAVLWLAYTDLDRIPPWLWGILLAMLAIVLIKPRSLVFIIPIAFILVILHPRVWPKGRKGMPR